MNVVNANQVYFLLNIKLTTILLSTDDARRQDYITWTVITVMNNYNVRTKSSSLTVKQILATIFRDDEMFLG